MQGLIVCGLTCRNRNTVTNMAGTSHSSIIITRSSDNFTLNALWSCSARVVSGGPLPPAGKLASRQAGMCTWFSLR